MTAPRCGGAAGRCLRGLRRGLGWAENTFIGLLLLTMVGLAALRIVRREMGWNIDLMWADQMLTHMVLWVALLGAALATKDRNHINIDVVGRLLRGRAKSITRAVTDLFSAVVCVALTYACHKFFHAEHEAFRGATLAGAQPLFWKVAPWHAQLVMPFAFALMAVRFLVQTVEDVVAAVTGRPVEDPRPTNAVSDPQEAES